MDWKAVFSWEAFVGHAIWPIVFGVIMWLVSRTFRWVNGGKKLNRKQEAVYALACIIAGTTFCAALMFGNGLRASNSKNDAPDFQPVLGAFNVGVRYEKPTPPTGTALQRPSFVFFMLEIYNRGGPSIIRRWDLEIILSGGNTKLTGKMISPPPQMSFVSQHGQPDRVIKYENWIVPKTSTIPVPHGGSEIGFICFEVPNTDLSVLQSPGVRFRLSFRDIEDRVYNVDEILPGQTEIY
jgi:hypothetical protein